MKKSILNFATVALLSAAIFGACNNPQDPTVDEARKNADQAEKELQDAKNDAQDSQLMEDRTAFKAEAMRKIADNELKIAELKEKQKTSGKMKDSMLQTRIDALEKRNNELREKVSNYEDTDDAKWQEFKREFNHDMDELGKSINDMGKDNVK